MSEWNEWRHFLSLLRGLLYICSPLNIDILQVFTCNCFFFSFCTSPLDDLSSLSLANTHMKMSLTFFNSTSSFPPHCISNCFQLDLQTFYILIYNTSFSSQSFYLRRAPTSLKSQPSLQKSWLGAHKRCIFLQISLMSTGIASLLSIPFPLPCSTSHQDYRQTLRSVLTLNLRFPWLLGLFVKSQISSCSHLVQKLEMVPIAFRIKPSTQDSSQSGSISFLLHRHHMSP